jgi:tRNA (guanine9-N1)-methyltransferase
MEAVKWGHENWNVKFEETPLEELKDSFDNMIYLTAEAEDSLQSFEEGKTYIIGGIVDKNRHKGICYDKAKRLGLKMAKLPITEYIKLLSRQVLTVNQVVEIICKQLETKNWEAALNEAVPQRKLIKENEQQPSESITPEYSE